MMMKVLMLNRNIRNNHSSSFSTLLKKLRNSISSSSNYFDYYSSIHSRPFSLSAIFAPHSRPTSDKENSQKNNNNNENNKITSSISSTISSSSSSSKQPLSVFFKEAVERTHITTTTNLLLDNDEIEDSNLKNKLRKLEDQIRKLNSAQHSEKKKGKLKTKRSLSELFTNKKKNNEESSMTGKEDPMVYKKLSPDMEMFAHHLYNQGYFNTASFVPRHKFDPTCFEVSYAREFLKFAAVKFGNNHQEISKWLSASDLKKVALFGCPALGHKTIYAAKHMRKFFQIEEHKVCQKCVLKESCKHANFVTMNSTEELHLGTVTKVLAVYALDSVPQQLVVPQEIKDSVSRLLKELVNLTHIKDSDEAFLLS